MRQITEEPRLGPVEESIGEPGSPALWWAHPRWESRFPWVIQGTTAREPGKGAGDFALFRESGPTAPSSRWTDFAQSLGFQGVFHARQVHGRKILFHGSQSSGLVLGPDADGHLTSQPGVLMAVTVADCVPVFLVDSEGRGGGVLHAGWRGVVAGILEAGVGMMMEGLKVRPGDLFLHLGPSICGACYEVGPEVHEALGLLVPAGPRPVDLRQVLAQRALSLGLDPDRISISTHCTLCGVSPFFSHRGGDPQRQIGFLGIRSSRE